TAATAANALVDAKQGTPPQNEESRMAETAGRSFMRGARDGQLASFASPHDHRCDEVPLAVHPPPPRDRLSLYASGRLTGRCSGRGDGQDMIAESWAFSREAVAAGEVWRLFSASAAHLSWAHLGSNLAVFGGALLLLRTAARPI